MAPEGSIRLLIDGAVGRPTPNTALVSGILHNGSREVRLSTPVPCIGVEEWVEDASSDYAESVTQGSRVERAPGRTTVHKYRSDAIRKLLLRYSVTVEMLPETGAYRVLFADSDIAPPKPPPADWKTIAPSRYPAPQLVRDGDSVRLDLYTAPENGEKLVDYIHVGAIDKMVLRTEAPHESYADDAAFHLTRPEARVNGMDVEATAGPEVLEAPVVWIYAPGLGRFVVTLARHTELGFSGEGDVASNLLTFTEGGNVIRLECAERIASGAGVYRVHVLKDPEWMPADLSDRGRFVIGASPAVEAALR